MGNTDIKNYMENINFKIFNEFLRIAARLDELRTYIAMDKVAKEFV